MLTGQSAPCYHRARVNRAPQRTHRPLWCPQPFLVGASSTQKGMEGWQRNPTRWRDSGRARIRRDAQLCFRGQHPPDRGNPPRVLASPAIAPAPFLSRHPIASLLPLRSSRPTRGPHRTSSPCPSEAWADRHTATGQDVTRPVRGCPPPSDAWAAGPAARNGVRGPADGHEKGGSSTANRMHRDLRAGSRRGEAHVALRHSPSARVLQRVATTASQRQSSRGRIPGRSQGG